METGELFSEPSTDENSSEDGIFCSVLNVVIDHSMVAPSLLEPLEYKKKSIKVPVLRIFGPVLRDPTRGPLQSACLYVHAAFPYLLARPVVAGPDGSLKRTPADTGQVNWDDRASVELCADTIASTLEAAIQSLDLERKGDQKQAFRDDAPVIREVTVVEGRGFFTYCPGPPAPFLRIEYYNPKLRWKVKLMMEKGLDLPTSYHPNPIQYDRPLDEQGPGDALRFHCYEAHIPYTMQFFKDWNLAGSSYLHLKHGKIRGRLPESLHHCKYQSSPPTDGDSSAVFLSSNTPQKYQWGDTPLPEPTSQGSTSGSQLVSHDWTPPPKETSCDIEIDCTVHDLMNVETVLKTMPSDLEERDKIQWRAVPSLQEIWRQERRRMSKLLAPAHDFLSHPPSQKLPFTLNVKQGAARSGARLAAKGMKSLVQVTYGLDDDFSRVLGQILERHSKSVRRVDQELQQRRSLHSPEPVGVKKLQLTPTWNEAVDALGSLAVDSSLSQSEPTMDEAVSALGSLKVSPVAKQLETNLTSQKLDDGPSQDQYSQSDGMSILDMSGSQSSGHSQEKQLSYSCSQEIHEGTSMTMDPVIYSQRMERGDGVTIQGTAHEVEDVIDPETLLPFENLDFGNDRCRVKFSVDSDPPNRIRICGNMWPGCQREGHDEDALRAKPGYYSTVTTGVFVDGVLDSAQPENTDFDEEDKAEFERDLSVLASQMPTKQPTPASSNTTSILRSDAMLTQGQYPNVAQAMGIESSDEINEEAPDSGSDGSDNETDEDQLNHLTPVAEPSSGSTQSIEKPRPPDTYPALVTPNVEAPTRMQTTRSGSHQALHPVESESKTPSWLSNAYAYDALMNKKGRSTSHLSPKVSPGSHVQPVLGPPSRGAVAAWQRKRSAQTNYHNPAKRHKVEPKGDSIQCKATSNTLELDGNSRKVLAMAKASKGVSNILPDTNVEEVQWESSELWQLSMTQQTQSLEAKVDSAVKRDRPTQGRLAGTGGKQQPEGFQQSDSQSSDHALDGIGAQGGRINVQGGGTLKAKTSHSQVPDSARKHAKTAIHEARDISMLPSPVSFMSIEVHVQCRTGSSRLDSKKMSMVPDSNKDRLVAIVFVYGTDPGGGQSLLVMARGCLFVPLETEVDDRMEQVRMLKSSMPHANLGVQADLTVECVKDEKTLLLRLASIVRMKDPDMVLSWDTQGSGLGYIIERGVVLGGPDNESNSEAPGVDMVRLLGRTPHDKSNARVFVSLPKESAVGEGLEATKNPKDEKQWKGSGLGSDWDERVGAGAAAASIVGRLVFAGWKIVAEEVKHPNYSYQPAVVAAVLNRRVPHHDDLLLTQWYASRKERWRVLNHRLNQAMATLLLFDALDIIGRAGEAARLSGVEFSQSFPGIRGSQYKVEGVLLRALQSLRSDERGAKKGKAKNVTPVKTGMSLPQTTGTASLSTDTRSPTQSPWKLRRGNNERGSSLENRQYFFFSPSLEDTNKQEALEVQALTLEPLSGHYTDPVVVCDFTALYPSLVIAYNLCYSTCAGRLDYHTTRREMQLEGKTSGRLGPFVYPERRTATVLAHHMKELDKEDIGPNFGKQAPDRAYVAPTGTIYVSEDVVKGVLPQVLDEILTTRAMLKRAAKEYKKHVKNLSPAILRQLEARQLALKYVANVTYGYTSATFSGRCAMPVLADTIVECGRKTLRKAINLANRWGKEGRRWKGAQVIYGDTDSLFVRLPGRTYKEAFDFGEELCRAVTADNPPPVQLKLEKVYLGSIMQTMKRYCGMKFESKSQKKPTFEAKGLETIRRDQCALTQKVLRNALITLFRSGIGEVKAYLFRQWSMIFAGQIPVSDFILTGRVRSKYRGGREGPVQAVLARRIGEADPGRIIRHKERLPYVIVATPGITFRLKDCVLTPLELLERWDAYTIHSAYYIQRHVNASLQRCLGLAPHFADVNAWYESCPKPRRRIHFWPVRSKNRAMITTYFGSDVCSLCQRKCQASGRARVVVCADCRADNTSASQAAMTLLNSVETSSNVVAKECSRCNQCFEHSSTFAALVDCDDLESRPRKSDLLKDHPSGERLKLPLANCVCIDCPRTFQRHRLREQLIEAQETCGVLGLI